MEEAAVDSGLRQVLRLPEQVLESSQACVTGSAARVLACWRERGQERPTEG